MRTRVVVGIAGGSGSGKTTVVDGLSGALGPERTAVLPHDAYYFDLGHLAPAERIEVNVDHPDSLETALLVKHVARLRAGEAVEMPDYDYVRQTRAPVGIVVEPAPVLLLEGLFPLADPRIRALLDLAVFVDAPEAERLARRIERDVAERGRSRDEVFRWHHDRVEPMHRAHVGPSRAHADVVVEGGGHNLAAVAALAARILALLDG